MRICVHRHSSRVETPVLTSDCVQLWLLDLDAEPADGGTGCPAADDRARRLRDPLLRRRFIVARQALHTLLSRYTGVAPQQLRLQHGPFGKPRLTEQQATLSFNSSRSGRLGLIAIASAGELGVDIERHQSDTEMLDIARACFSAQETAALTALPPIARQQGFFDVWTRKEAYIKGLGVGLSRPLDSFEVSAESGCQDALLSDRLQPANASCWTVTDLKLAVGYSAALAWRRVNDDDQGPDREQLMPR